MQVHALMRWRWRRLPQPTARIRAGSCYIPGSPRSGASRGHHSAVTPDRQDCLSYFSKPMEQLGLDLAPARQIFTVSELTEVVRALLEDTFGLIWRSRRASSSLPSSARLLSALYMVLSFPNSEPGEVTASLPGPGARAPHVGFLEGSYAPCDMAM